MNKQEKILIQQFRIIKNACKKIDVDLDVGLDQELMSDLLMRRSQFKKKKVPRTKARSNFVGVELECYGTTQWEDLAMKFYEAGLEEKVNIGDDGSINVDNNDQNTYEIRVMDTEGHIAATLKTVLRILNQNKFKVNESCGTHVHIDCRHRTKEKVFRKLLNVQHLMFGLVTDERTRNDNCVWADVHSTDKYHSFYRHQHKNTVEVRLHHGTLDYKRLTSWIKLLLLIVNSKKDLKARTPRGLKQQAKLSRSMKYYLNHTFVPRTRGVDFDEDAAA